MKQLTILAFFCAQPAPTAAARQAIVEFNEDAIAEIEEKQERILELRKEISDAKEEFSREEEDDLDMEPDEGEEVLFDVIAPQLEANLEYTRAENESHIKELEEEIKELEGGLA